MTLPDFLVIGTPRAGTTSLHHYLGQHPDVFIPSIKEPNYFAFEEGPLRAGGPGSDWLVHNSTTTAAEYEALFAGAGQATAIGEVSPRYLSTPEAPARVARMIPDARLVAILREPVERSYAGYLARRRDGVEPARSFEAALADEQRRLREDWLFIGYLDPGFYHRHLARWLEHFPRERLRVYLHDDLLADPLGLLADLFSFIGVDPAFAPDVQRHHGRTGAIASPALGLLWRHTRRLRIRMGFAVPDRLAERGRERILRDLVKPALDPRTRAWLHELYRPDTLALARLIDRDLSAWLEPRDHAAVAAGGSEVPGR